MKNFGYYKNNIDSILENSFTNSDKFKRKFIGSYGSYEIL